MNKEVSIVTRLFRIIMVTILLVFGVQYLYQTIIFPSTYKYNVINSIEDELFLLFENTTQASFSNELGGFATRTQTSNFLISSSELNLEFINSSLILKSITVIDENNSLYTVILPRIFGHEFEVGEKLTLNLTKVDDIYYPSQITSNEEMVLSSKRSSEISVNATVIFTNYPTSESINTDLIETVSESLYNYITGNYKDLENYEYGLSFIGLNNDQREHTINYLSFVEYNNRSTILVSIYQLDQITFITDALSKTSIILYFAILVILIFMMNKYLKAISYPLKTISNYCKRIAKLDFSNPLEEIKSKDEIGEINRSVNQMSINLQTALRELEKQKEQISIQMEREQDREQINKDFVAGLSHELKTPLGVIKAASESIHLKIFEGEELEKQFETISLEIDKANKLIVDMIKVYEVDSNNPKKNYSLVNLKDIILKVDKSLSIVAESKNIEVFLDLSDTSSLLDRQKMELVISNLYSNAVKYTDKGEKIYIKLFEEGTRYVFTILNTGAEIPDELIENLFEPFFRINKARSRDLGSTGLGLYIVKQILDQMNSNYGAKNTENGVLFYFDVEKELTE